MAKPLKRLLETVIPRSHHWKIVIFKQWDTIIGNLKDKVWIEKIDNSVLYLKVSHPTWAHELSLLSPMLTKKINALFTEKKISTIRLRSASIQKQKRKKQRPQTSTPQTLTPLSSEEKKILESLKDTQLQSAFAAYFVKCKTQKRSLPC